MHRYKGLKIFFLNWNGYGNQDIIDTLKAMEGVDISIYPFDAHTPRDDAGFIRDFQDALRKENPDFVLSYNYFPVVSIACNKAGVKYASWIYDNPAVSLYSYTLINSCNYVFIFDSNMYETFARQGIKTVYYMPLAAAVRRYDKLSITDKEIQKWGGRISFVGGLYRDRGNFYDRIKDKIEDYSRGYLEGLMRAQMQIDGLDVVESSLPKRVLEDMILQLGLKPNFDGVESEEYLYSNYVIDRKMTSIERQEIMEIVGEKYGVNLYTDDDEFVSPGVVNRGSVDYYEEMPYVFKTSDINLNISLRSIHSGIPLRAMDIMGCGGFLITNYQEDMLRFFVPGEDFVYYESRQDLLDKIGYYLEHEDERKEIAKSGHEKIINNHTYEQRLEEIIDIVTKA